MGNDFGFIGITRVFKDSPLWGSRSRLHGCLGENAIGGGFCRLSGWVVAYLMSQC